MDLQIVKFIQRASCDFLDSIFSFITVIGETSMLFMMFVAIYLCYKKDFAVKYLLFFMISGAFNSVLKSIVSRPRPYTHSGVLDIRHTSGYSFPSGHSQNSAFQATMISTEYCKQNKQLKYRLWVIIPLIVTCLLVGFSRIYLGQHYLTDVLMGLALGVGLALLLQFLFSLIPSKVKKFLSVRAVLLILIIPVLLILVLVEYGNMGSESMVTTIYTYLAIYMGVLVGYNIDKTYIKYQEQSPWQIQVIKIFVACVGIALLSFSFKGISNETVRSFSFYFTATLYVTALLPFVFKLLFSKYNNCEKLSCNCCKNINTENSVETKQNDKIVQDNKIDSGENTSENNN